MVVPTSGPDAQKFVVGAYVCAALAFLFVPILFGPIGFYLAHRAEKEGLAKGRTAKGVVIGASLLGIVVSMTLYQPMFLS